MVRRIATTPMCALMIVGKAMDQSQEPVNLVTVQKWSVLHRH